VHQERTQEYKPSPYLRSPSTWAPVMRRAGSFMSRRSTRSLAASETVCQRGFEKDTRLWLMSEKMASFGGGPERGTTRENDVQYHAHAPEVSRGAVGAYDDLGRNVHRGPHKLDARYACTKQRVTTNTVTVVQNTHPCLSVLNITLSTVLYCAVLCTELCTVDYYSTILCCPVQDSTVLYCVLTRLHGAGDPEVDELDGGVGGGEARRMFSGLTPRCQDAVGVAAQEGLGDTLDDVRCGGLRVGAAVAPRRSRRSPPRQISSCDVHVLQTVPGHVVMFL